MAITFQVAKVTSGKNAHSRVHAYDDRGLPISPYSFRGINGDNHIEVCGNKASHDGDVFHDGGSSGTHAQAIAAAKRYLKHVHDVRNPVIKADGGSPQYFKRHYVVSGKSDMDHGHSRDFLGVSREESGLDESDTHHEGDPVIEDDRGFWSEHPGLAGHPLESDNREDAIKEAHGKFGYGDGTPFAVYEGKHIRVLPFEDGEVFKPHKLVFSQHPDDQEHITKAHDVSNEARDKNGRWTSTETAADQVHREALKMGYEGSNTSSAFGSHYISLQHPKLPSAIEVRVGDHPYNPANGVPDIAVSSNGYNDTSPADAIIALADKIGAKPPAWALKNVAGQKSWQAKRYDAAQKQWEAKSHQLRAMAGTPDPYSPSFKTDHADWVKRGSPDLLPDVQSEAKRLNGGKTASGYKGLELLNEAVSKLYPELKDVGRQLENGSDPALQKSHQTDTPQFKRWFGASKVVDEHGKPKMVYHGTGSKPFNEFSADWTNPAGRHENGQSSYFFTDNHEVADSYANAPGRKFPRPRHIPVYLSFQNPLVVDAKGMPWSKLPNTEFGNGLSTFDLTRRATRSGKYDGLIIKNVWDWGPAAAGKVNASSQKSTDYVAFDARQIKSAIGNNGNFDPDDPDITKSRNVDILENEILKALGHIRDDNDVSDRFNNIEHTFPSSDIKTEWPENIGGHTVNAWVHPNGKVTHWPSNDPEHDKVAKHVVGTIPSHGNPHWPHGRHANELMNRGYVRYYHDDREAAMSHVHPLTSDQHQAIQQMVGDKTLRWDRHDLANMTFKSGMGDRYVHKSAHTGVIPLIGKAVDSQGKNALDKVAKTDWPENISSKDFKAWIHPNGKVTHWHNDIKYALHHDDVARHFDLPDVEGNDKDDWGGAEYAAMHAGYARYWKTNRTSAMQHIQPLTSEQHEAVKHLSDADDFRWERYNPHDDSKHSGYSYNYLRKAVDPIDTSTQSMDFDAPPENVDRHKEHGLTQTVGHNQWKHRGISIVKLYGQPAHSQFQVNGLKPDWRPLMYDERVWDHTFKSHQAAKDWIDQVHIGAVKGGYKSLLDRSKVNVQGEHFVPVKSEMHKSFEIPEQFKKVSLVIVGRIAI